MSGQPVPCELLSWDESQRWIDLIPDGVLIVDAEGIIQGANIGMQALCGRSAQALVGQPLGLLLPADLLERHQHHLARYFAQPQVRAMGRVQALRLCHSDGQIVPVDISLGLCRHDEKVCAVAVIRDVTELRALHEQARHQAMHDNLTGLYNRAMFGELLVQAVEQCQRSAQVMALLLLDLDDFKSINDGYGHHVGDAVLVEVAQRMRGLLRGSDVLARLGGDEFAVLLRDQDDPSQAEQVAEKLVQAIGQPWRLGHHEMRPGASIGIALMTADGSDAATLLQRADMAMYRAKEAGRGCHAVYDAGMTHLMEQTAQLKGRLKRALEADALRLHYQPQIDARSGAVVGLEAMLRWHDAELGEVEPLRCLAVAEGTGLMLPLGDWMLSTACQQIAAWARQGLCLRVAVKLSVHQLRQPDFAQRLGALLERWDVPAPQLELQITETIAINPRIQASGMLECIAALGVKLTLDDFGMGFSSLSHLQQLPVTRLKIDRQFIQGLPGQAQDAALMRALIGLAGALGKTLVAQGVETEAQREFLQREGCDVLQGRLFAPDLPPEQIAALVAGCAEGVSSSWAAT